MCIHEYIHVHVHANMYICNIHIRVNVCANVYHTVRGEQRVSATFRSWRSDPCASYYTHVNVWCYIDLYTHDYTYVHIYVYMYACNIHIHVSVCEIAYAKVRNKQRISSSFCASRSDPCVSYHTDLYTSFVLNYVCMKTCMWYSYTLEYTHDTHIDYALLKLHYVRMKT